MLLNRGGGWYEDLLERLRAPVPAAISGGELRPIYPFNSSGLDGFSSGSTIASTTAARGERKAASIAGRISPGWAHRNPSAPQAVANATKSIGDKSQP